MTCYLPHPLPLSPPLFPSFTHSIPFSSSPPRLSLYSSSSYFPHPPLFFFSPPSSLLRLLHLLSPPHPHTLPLPIFFSLCAPPSSPPLFIFPCLSSPLSVSPSLSPLLSLF